MIRLGVALQSPSGGAAVLLRVRAAGGERGTGRRQRRALGARGTRARGRAEARARTGRGAAVRVACGRAGAVAWRAWRQAAAVWGRRARGRTGERACERVRAGGAGRNSELARGGGLCGEADGGRWRCTRARACAGRAWAGWGVNAGQES